MPEQIQETAWDVSSSFAEWGIKRSLREYVLGTDDGTIEWIAPASASRFPATGIVARSPVDELWATYEGAVRFRAHNSLMDVVIGSITLEIGATGAAISIAGLGSGPSAVFAEHQGSVSRAEVNGVIEIHIEHPALTSRGAAFLGGVYSRGTLLDPLRLVLALDPAHGITREAG
jgi:hypothetical protein